MTTHRVHIQPMPASYLEIPEKWRPGHPPIFPAGSPTAEDIAEARALFAKLDRASQDWYLRGGAQRLFAGVKLRSR